MLKKNLIILGAGPAGLTAALYAARANLDPTIISGMDEGGQITKTHVLDNWPGDVQGIDGMTLASRFVEHAKRFNTNIINDNIIAVDFKQRPFYLKGENEEYFAHAVIIATGASPRLLNLPRETELTGKGVSYCAVCDGYFYKGAKIAVIGGSDTAVIDALYLANIAKEVVLVHRRNQLRAEPILIDKLMKTPNVTFEWDSVVTEILGDETVTGARLQNVKNNQTKDLIISGLFIAIGYKPNTDIFINQLEMNEGYIKVKGGLINATATSIDGVFAAGDVINPNYQQAVIAAASGAMAAMDVKKAINN